MYVLKIRFILNCRVVWKIMFKNIHKIIVGHTRDKIGHNVVGRSVKIIFAAVIFTVLVDKINMMFVNKRVFVTAFQIVQKLIIKLFKHRRDYFIVYIGNLIVYINIIVIVAFAF